MRVLVCGGRDYDEFGKMIAVLDQFEIDVIGHGAAPGADSLAQQYAEYRGYPAESWPADWDRHGNAAGPIRNRQMFKEFNPDLVVAFPGGKGTADMVSVAQKGKCAVFVVPRNDLL